MEGIIARYFKDTSGSIVSTGSAPNYAVATERSLALEDGVEVAWRAHASFASGTATLTVNALTQKNLKRQDGTALGIGDIAEDQTVVSRYNADMDAWECLGITGRATQAEMEAASSSAVAVTPAVQHFHPGHPKCWAYVTVSGGTPTLRASYNITSITDSGTGSLTITIANDFSGGYWAHAVSVDGNPSFADTLYATSKSSGGIVLNYDANGARDPAAWSFIGLGDI